ncbi:MAG TPA: hypothetical protein DEA85_02465, partial [Firmicutes bacterium]|nr:hypothetical protein [Bacillota bacterium]
LGGVVDGKNLFLETDGRKVWGRVGGDFIGFSADLQYEQGYLKGRLGGEVLGHDVNLEAPESDPLLAGLIACLTYYYYKVTDTGHNHHHHN